jgi:hypothetical protein
MHNTNAILILIIVLIACAALLVWIVPDMALRLSNILYARQKAQRAARAAYRDAYEAAMAERMTA